MHFRLVICLAVFFALLGSAHSQTPAQIPLGTGAAKAAQTPGAVSPDQAVITLKNGCQPFGNTPPADNCIRTVTRQQFEVLAEAMQPGMQPEAKRAFANNYGKLLVYSDVARSLKLQDKAGVQAIIQYMVDRILADALARHYAEEFAQPTEQQLQAYYDKNRANYAEATLQRIVIPRTLGDNESPEANNAANAALVNNFRQRWIAGEDAAKLQQEAFAAAGIKEGGSPDVNLGPRRKGSLPTNQESVFDLKTGEISQAYTDPSASYLYKVVSVREIPLDELKETILKSFQQQQLIEKMEAVEKSATPELSDQYFGYAAGPAPAAAQTAEQVGPTPKTSN